MPHSDEYCPGCPQCESYIFYVPPGDDIKQYRIVANPKNEPDGEFEVFSPNGAWMGYMSRKEKERICPDK